MTAPDSPQLSSTSTFIHGAIATSASLAWYAMPDVIRSKKARTVAKLGLAGVIAVNEAAFLAPAFTYIRENFVSEDTCCCGVESCSDSDDARNLESPHLGSAVLDAHNIPADCADRPNLGDLDDEIEYPSIPMTEETGKLPIGAVAAGTAAGLTLLSLALVSTERFIFRRGEKRRAAGVHRAHTRQGVALAGVTAALCALDYALDRFCPTCAEKEN